MAYEILESVTIRLEFETGLDEGSQMKRERRAFTPEFKAQMVKLYESGKLRKVIISEYDLTPSPLDKWLKQRQTSVSFTEKDNRTQEEEELIKLRKETQLIFTCEGSWVLKLDVQNST